MKLPEIAAKIAEHLKRFEADPSINIPMREGSDLRPYFKACACTVGRYARVTYVSYQGGSSLTKAEATAYLEWLDAGNVGQHFKFQRLSNAAEGARA